MPEALEASAGRSGEVRVARRRGFFAEIAHQQQVAARQREQQQRAAARAQAAAQRQADAAHRRSQALQTKMLRAAAAEMKAMEKEAKRLHEEAMAADADAQNADLLATYDEIDSMLSATLEVDDWVDLNTLRVVPEYPSFPHPELELPTPAPAPVPVPPEPQYVPPPPATGLFGKKKREAEATAQAKAEFAAAHQAWQAAVALVPQQQAQQDEAHRAAEVARAARLEAARAKHQIECERLDADAAEANAELDTLIAGVAYGTDEALQEYVGIVLSNSVYPEAFPVSHEHRFDSSLRELDVTVVVPSPDRLPTTKEFKYVKSKDEIVESTLPKTQQKERYVGAVHQVALRTLHEVFEADRAGWIQTIRLTVEVDATDPATGRARRTSLVAVGTAREGFAELDLSNVVPLAALQHLGAVVSKNPFDLVAIDSKGVRRQ